MQHINLRNHHPLQERRVVEKHFNSLPVDDISHRLYNGTEKYVSSWWTKLKVLLSVPSYLNELHSFYPYQVLITRRHKDFHSDLSHNFTLGIIGSVALVYAFSYVGPPSSNLPGEV